MQKDCKYCYCWENNDGMENNRFQHSIIKAVIQNHSDTETEPVGPIDYIFVKPTFSVKSFEVVDTLINGRYPSDHFPVKAELKMRAR